MHLLANSPNYALKIRSRVDTNESGVFRLNSFKEFFSFTFTQRRMEKNNPTQNLNNFKRSLGTASLIKTFN